jgi:hypothetical protein
MCNLCHPQRLRQSSSSRHLRFDDRFDATLRSQNAGLRPGNRLGGLRRHARGCHGTGNLFHCCVSRAAQNPVVRPPWRAKRDAVPPPARIGGRHHPLQRPTYDSILGSRLVGDRRRTIRRCFPLIRSGEPRVGDHASAVPATQRNHPRIIPGANVYGGGGRPPPRAPSGWPTPLCRTVLSGSLDVASGRALRNFTGQGDQVNSVAFSPDGRTVLSGSSDMTARIWSTVTRDELARRVSSHRAQTTGRRFCALAPTAAASPRWSPMDPASALWKSGSSGGRA